MFCTKCGAAMEEGAAFCTECGASAHEEAVQEPVAASVEESVSAPVEEPIAVPVETPAVSAVEETKKTNNGKVGFIEAIKLAILNSLNFTGRASRSEFWWGYLFFAIAGIVASIPYIGWLISLAIVLPSLALSVRRLNDIGRRWSFLFMGLIPIAGAIILIINFCKPSID